MKVANSTSYKRGICERYRYLDTPNLVGQIAVQPKLDSVAETLMKESNSH